MNNGSDAVRYVATRTGEEAPPTTKEEMRLALGAEVCSCFW